MEKILLQTPDFEDKNTKNLLVELSSVKEQGYLNKAQFIKILRWKSNRPLRHYETNNEETVQATTKIAFQMPDDNLKIHVLTALTGVNYPSASAILMFYDPEIYPVLDMRVWQQLHQGRLVNINARGQGFTIRQWEIYLTVIRSLAVKLNLSARQVEKRLFDHDKLSRDGTLYKYSSKKAVLTTSLKH